MDRRSSPIRPQPIGSATILSVVTPEGKLRAWEALGAGIEAAAARALPELQHMLDTRFADIFVREIGGVIAFRRAPSAMIEFVQREHPQLGWQTTMRPGRRFTDLALAVAELAGLEVDFVDGWPVIEAACADREAAQP